MLIFYVESFFFVHVLSLHCSFMLLLFCHIISVLFIMLLMLALLLVHHVLPMLMLVHLIASVIHTRNGLLYHHRKYKVQANLLP